LLYYVFVLHWNRGVKFGNTIGLPFDYSTSPLAWSDVYTVRGTAGDGSVLRTLVLRPTVIYGELDPWYVVSGLRAAHHHGGILLPVGNGEARMQVSYAGNVAWAHLFALSH